MAVELVGAKLLAPYFGTSLYIWAAALGITLGGLTIGYFLGGRLSKKYTGKEAVLYTVLACAGAVAMIMPFTSQWVMDATISMQLQTGAILSLICFMMPPLILMGMVSPLIINLLTEQVESAGNSAGNVYAISTLGGILATFLMGFYIIPNYGLTMPTIIVGGLLAIGPVISLLKSRQVALPIILLLLFVGLPFAKGSLEKTAENYNVLYHSEGILGQIKVVDHPAYGIAEDKIGRSLIVNNTLQTFMDTESKLSLWEWAHYFPAATSVYPAGSKVLLLGLGGGTLVKQLESLNFDVDVVEIDQRVKDVCVQFFNVSPDLNMIVDDARHYIKISDQKYDIIIYDTFLSESVPEHLLTMEGFEDAKRILKPKGVIMSNFYGFINGEKGKAARSVYKTFEASGFKTDILATPGEPQNRNLIFIASTEDLEFDQINYQEGSYEPITDLFPHFLTTAIIDMDDAELLRDSYPKLSKMYAKSAMEWKKGYNRYYREHFDL